MKTSRLLKETVKEIADLYDQGLTDKKIAHRLSIPEESVIGWRRRNKFPQHKDAVREKKTDVEILALIDANKDMLVQDVCNENDIDYRAACIAIQKRERNQIRADAAEEVAPEDMADPIGETIALQDDEIKSLKTLNEELRGRIDRQKGIILHLEETVDELNAELEKRGNTIADLDRIIANQEKEIEELIKGSPVVQTVMVDEGANLDVLKALKNHIGVLREENDALRRRWYKAFDVATEVEV